MSEEQNLDWINKHPVSKVIWVPVDSVHANDYNPNTVAPPEMKLLEVSIEADGFTQPIVVWEVKEGEYEVVDGFHRHLVGKKLGLSHLPVVVINKDRTSKSNRMSSTVRHNRARGKHGVTGMSDIVKDLYRLKWKDEKICKELGMDMDEVLRLKQISGLMEMFEDKDFSKAWEFNEETVQEIVDTIDKKENV
jgi:ParB-like chromosome segregation protein Spo0J